MSFSVLMSVYGKDKPCQFEKAIESVWTKQTLKPDFIVIVVDGPVPKAIFLIVDKWKSILGDIMIILENKFNIGLTRSLNIGLARINTEFVARMDSDDISDEFRFEKQIRFLQRNPSVHICGGAIQEFSEKNRKINIRRYPQNASEIRDMIHKASPLAHPAVMMRMSIFREGLMYNEKYKTSQDIALWFDALCRGFNIANLSDIVLYFRRSGDLLDRRSRGKALNEFFIYINGTRRINGLISPRYIYPLARLFLRLMPNFLIAFFYDSRLRKFITERHREVSVKRSTSGGGDDTFDKVDKYDTNR